MAPNTKIGLLVGLLFIIGIGMLLSQQGQAGHDMGQLVTNRNDPERGAGPGRPSGGTALTALTDRPGPSLIDAPAHRPSADAHARLPLTPPQYPSDGAAVADGGRSPDPIRDALRPIDPVLPPPITVSPPTAAAQPLPPGWKTHKVQAGETLSAISTKHYQTSRNFEMIYAANKDKMPNVNTLREGTEIRIPPVAQPVVTAPPPAASPAPPVAGSGNALVPPGPSRPVAPPVAAATYRVKDGDTLYSIAASVMGGRGQWQALYEANKDVISDPNRLKIGQVLKVPAARLALQ